jgi:hypothetical protein
MLPIFGRSAGRKPPGLLPDELTSSLVHNGALRGAKNGAWNRRPENGTAASQSWNVEIECLDASGSYHYRDE